MICAYVDGDIAAIDFRARHAIMRRRLLHRDYLQSGTKPLHYMNYRDGKVDARKVLCKLGIPKILRLSPA